MRSSLTTVADSVVGTIRRSDKISVGIIVINHAIKHELTREIVGIFSSKEYSDNMFAEQLAIHRLGYVQTKRGSNVFIAMPSPYTFRGYSFDYIYYPRDSLLTPRQQNFIATARQEITPSIKPNGFLVAY